MVLATSIGSTQSGVCPDIHIRLIRDTRGQGVYVTAAITITNTSNQKIEYYNRDPSLRLRVTVLTASGTTP